MGTVTLLRDLTRLRVAVAIIAVVALAVSLAMTFRIGLPPQSRHHEVGLASTSALVDTPQSQVVDLGGKDSAASVTLPGRTALLASLLTTSPLKDEIARRAGIDPRTLIASSAPGGSTVAVTGAPLASGATVKPDDPRASTLKLATDTTLPILTVDVEAPDVGVATRLANGTIQTLQAHLATVASAEGVPETRRIVVKQLGPARSGATTRGPSRLVSVGAGLFVFLIGCGALLFIVRLATEWRRTEELERMAASWGTDADTEVPSAPARW